MSNNIATNMRKWCLTPATGQHLCVIYDSGNTYYYVIYKNKYKSAYLAYSTDAITWNPTKLLVKEAVTTIVNGTSLALDHTNKKIYVVYSEFGVSSSEIKVVPIDCSTPSNPVLGSESIITGYSNYYDMPVCALGVDGGLHVGANRYNFSGQAITYYVVKSGISVGEPDLTSWSAVYNIGNGNHAVYYGNMKIVAHPDNNRLQIWCIRFDGVRQMYYRSLNTTGAYDGWMALAIGVSSQPNGPHASYHSSIRNQIYDVGVISGWNYAFIIHHGSNSIIAEVYDFMGDTGVGVVPTIRYLTIFSGVSYTYVFNDSDVSVAAYAYPGDYQGQFFYEYGSAGQNLCSRAYSYMESYLTSTAVVESGEGEPSSLTSVWYPNGVYGDKVCFLELEEV